MTGTCRVKRTSLAGVNVGDLLTLTHIAAGLLAMKVRVAEMTIDKPDSPEVAIRWKEDRGWLNAISTAVNPDDVEPEGEYSAQPLLANVVLELPYGYLRESRPAVIFLPVRGDPLTGPKRYTIKILREWFGTRAETYATGTTAYVLQLGLEPAVTWTADLPEGTAVFKEQPYLLAQELDLATCPEIAVTIQKRAQRPAAPTNLRVFEDGTHPTYTTGQDIAVNWTPTSELRFGLNVAQNLECRADATILQVLTTGGTLKGEIAFAGNASPVRITNAQLVALLGGETDFKCRAYYSMAGLRSLA